MLFLATTFSYFIPPVTCVTTPGDTGKGFPEVPSVATRPVPAIFTVAKRCYLIPPMSSTSQSSVRNGAKGCPEVVIILASDGKFRNA